jgi:hypothetical protein
MRQLALNVRGCGLAALDALIEGLLVRALGHHELFLIADGLRLAGESTCG